MEDFEVWGVSTPATVSPSPDGASRGQRRAQVSILRGGQGWGRPGVERKETELEEEEER